jgi:MOSC domain-containing protein YiiM
MSGCVHAINLSPRGGVPKLPVASARLHELGFEGDAVRDHRHHGGQDRAVCLYALERIEALRAEGHGIFPGAVGENLTLAGLDWDKVAPGTRLRVGDEARLEVTTYAVPCRTTAPYVSGDLQRYHQTHRPGWSRAYARVLEGGTVRVSDPVDFTT